MADRGPAELALRLAPVLFLLFLPAVWLLWGPKPAAGYSLGAASSILSLWAGRLMVLSSITRDSGKVPAISKLQLALMVKLPIFALVIFFTNSLGLAAVEAFLGGYLLVYLALVLGALLQKDAPASTSDE